MSQIASPVSPAVPTPRRVSHALSLVMKLRSKSQLGELMQRIQASQDTVSKALGKLRYLHFSRFLPLWDEGMLLVVTEYDGEFDDYVMDFAAELSEEFTMILSYMEDAPPLPVHRYPREFFAYIERCSKPEKRSPYLPAHRDSACPYGDKTVLDILGAEVAFARFEPATLRLLEPGNPVNLPDVQANVLKGYRARAGVHLAVRFTGNAAANRKLVGRLAGQDGDKLAVTPAHPWPQGGPAFVLNLGFTYAGLRALGLEPAVLNAFPRAFVQGPAARADKTGDDPRAWAFGGPSGDSHALLSLYVRDADDLPRHRAVVDAVLRGAADVVYSRDVAPLDKQGHEIHFGYREGFAQPVIETGATRPGSSGKPYSQSSIPSGDVLLGAGLVNSRSGNHIGQLPPGLADNATYAAFRVMSQDVPGFERLLDDLARERGVDRETVAAQLMGRWRNGAPLVNHPARAPVGYGGREEHFDYAADPTGDRCPFSSHARRLNPRGGPVVGVPTGRHVIRRGMPYGPRIAPGNEGEERGLAGVFLCADLESQFEFLLRVWANGDLFAPRVRGTRDPFVGSPAPAGSSPSAMVTSTVGSLYLFMPGMAGLAWLAAGGSRPRYEAAVPAARPRAEAPVAFPGSVEFVRNPYPFYRVQRANGPMFVAGVSMEGRKFWVLSRDLVREVNQRPADFVKPDWPKLVPHHIENSGLFYMNHPRHTAVRPGMKQSLEEATAGSLATARSIAKQLIADIVNSPRYRVTGEFEVVEQYAKPLALRVFADWMGIPASRIGLVSQAVDTMMAGYGESAAPSSRLAAAAAANALGTYLESLMRAPVPPDGASEAVRAERKYAVGATAAGKCPMARALAQQTKPLATGSDRFFAADEATITAVHLTLGGYESVAFLVTTGTLNLLSHPDQLAKLRRGLRNELGGVGVEAAVEEMLRFDAPFSMSDRQVARDCELGGVALKKGEKVLLVFASANRDLAAADGETFRIDRATIGMPDAFGLDPAQVGGEHADGEGHRCLGAKLARMICRVAFEELLGAFDSLSLVSVGDWLPEVSFRSVTSLVVSARPS